MMRTFLQAGFSLMPLAAVVDSGIPSESAQVIKNYPQEVAMLRGELKKKFEEAAKISNEGGNEPQYTALLSEVKSLKRAKEALDEKWRKSFAEGTAGEENYALWDAGEITLSQLIMEYGACDYLYIIPQELSQMKLSLFSSVPLPRESWGEVIEMILAHNGIGVKKLSPAVKQLYILKLDPSAIEGIVSREEDLAFFDPFARIFFVFTPKPEQVKSIQAFFERFSDPKQTTIQSIASKIVLVSTRETVERLVGLYRAVWEKDQGKVVRLVNLLKIAPVEAEKVLKAVFGDPAAVKTRPSFYPGAGDEFSFLVLPQGLILIGEEESVQRAERIVADLEHQLEDPGEKVIYWYSCKHSNPDDIAEVLNKVYDSLIGAKMEKAPEVPPPQPPSPVPPNVADNPAQVFPWPPTTAFNPAMPVSPGFVQPGVIGPKSKSSFGNFVVDTKTASILMVVRREELSKIKNLIKKLDVPKRMVQIDVLLVEKRLIDRKEVGINFLNFGSTANQTAHNTGVIFSDNNFVIDEKQNFLANKGLFKFLFNRPPQAGVHPGLNLVYSFLLAQDDLRINANPSVLAINQTQATIAIVEEISIDNGAIQLTTQAGPIVEKSFTRAQYGTTILMTPTIHLPDPDQDDKDSPGSVSLQTDVTFDTTEILRNSNDRPPVTRRHIVNEVQVADGETVILGGLRRKHEVDQREKIPFLGDLPGIGKLFGATKTTDTNTEMYIFITPHIIRDPVDDLRRLRQEEYQKRPGDIPEFLMRIDQAKACERKNLFDNSIKMLLDKNPCKPSCKP
jgi:general secretion pathway protein D